MLEFDQQRNKYEEKLRELELDRDKELKSVAAKFDLLKKLAEENFYSQASNQILDSLRDDYHELQERSEVALLRLEPEFLDAVMQLQIILNKLKGTAKDDIAKIAETALGKRKGVRLEKALKSIESKELLSRTITSFASYDEGKGLYIFCPISGKDNKILARDLEDKLADILSEGSISPKMVLSQYKDEPRIDISYKADFEINKGFLLWNITTDSNTQYTFLMRSLIAKINELQPSKFRQVNLTHLVNEVPFDILDYALRQSTKTISTQVLRVDLTERLAQYGDVVSYEDAAKVLGMTTKGIKRNITMGNLVSIEDGVTRESLEKYFKRSRKTEAGSKGTRSLKFESKDYQQRRIEARTRLAQIESDEMTVKDVAYILGVTTSSVTQNYVKNELLQFSHYGRKIIITKDALARFIDSRRPTDKGWIN